MKLPLHLVYSFGAFCILCFFCAGCEADIRQSSVSKEAPSGGAGGGFANATAPDAAGASDAQQGSAQTEGRTSLGFVNSIASFAQDASGAPDAQPGSTPTEPPAAVQRQVIYTAMLRMRVKNVDVSHDSIAGFLGGYNAYIASDNRQNYSNQVENTMTIRVERSQFWNLLKLIGQQATYVDEKKVESQDVTGAIADVQERIKSKLAAEEQYRGIMQRTTKIPDILEVQQHLSAIREEIELMQSRLNRLTDEAAYSTITLRMYEKEREAYVAPEETFWSRAGEALEQGWYILTSFILGMLTVWPLCIAGGFLLYGIVRYLKAERRRRATSAPVVERKAKAPSTEEEQ